MMNEEIFEQLSEISLQNFGKEAMLRDELESLRKFHDFFRDNCEVLFFYFGMPVIDLYNKAAAYRR